MRPALVVLPLAVALLFTACARPSTSQSVSPTDSAPPNLIGRVVRACRESGVAPGRGPGWQVDLLVAIPPSTAGNAGVVAGKKTPVYVRRGAHTLPACHFQ